VVAVAGTPAENDLALDVVIGWWLCLGIDLAWKKGTRAAGIHRWIGADFLTRRVGQELCAIVRVPDAFADDLFERLAPLASGKGAVAEASLDTILGKAGRLSYVLPATRPFVAALWGARAGSQARAKSDQRNDAPPGHHACSRFSSAARWLRVLLKPPLPASEILPLEQVVSRRTPEIDRGVAAVQCDASTWGCGAVLLQHGKVVEWFACTWSAESADYLGIPLGRPEGQTAWEYLVVLLVLMVWGSRFAKPGLSIAGDNLAALNGALHLKGRSELYKITRELAWRKTRQGWKYEAGHLPTEHNKLSDALSRLAAPYGSDHKNMPEELLSLPRASIPDESLWWSFREE